MSVDGKKGGKQSRFSTLRVFKFSKNPPPGPPPPPPKDAVYLAANRSLASLSPDSIPGSPLSPDQYAASSSAVSLTLPAPKQQRSGLFKFATVSKKSAENSPVPTEEDDENISMPWNFQHHVHVDEGFSGLPPSWTTSLQEAGFSDDDIAAIQQRRLADRPRDRAHSPAAVLRPAPRSTSLPKSQHTPASSLSASSASASSASSSPVPELPRARNDDVSKNGPSPERVEFPNNDYKSERNDYRPYPERIDPKPPPSPKSPPPVYWRDEPQPLTLRKRRQAEPQPQSPPDRQHSPQQHSRQSSSPSPPPQASRSSSPSPPPSPPVRATINPKNLTLDLGLEDAGSSWSDAVLSATPWSASAGSPLFTVTAPPAPHPDAPALSELGSPTLGGVYSTGDVLYSPTSPTHLAYDDDGSPTANTHNLGVSPAGRDNRDSGMSDTTMLGVPQSAGVVRHVSIARRAVANVVTASASSTNLASASSTNVSTRMPPASPQSSHFGSSGSSESQDHQTPTTEVADEDDAREGLDYYLEGKNYLEGNGYRLEGGHRAHGQDERGQNHEDAEEERRRRDWEAMQAAAEVKPLAYKQPDAPPRKQPDARARMMVSATDTFGGPVSPDSPDGAPEDDEYEYGYEFPEEEDGYVENAVVSPRDGAYDNSRGAHGSPMGAFGGGSPHGAFGGGSPREGTEEDEEEEEDEEGTLGPKERAALGLANGTASDAPAARPTVITRATLSPGPLTALGLAQTPLTPAQRYAGWVAAAVAPLEDFIDEPVDPREYYSDLQEIAEGESGSVYAAVLVPTAPLHRLKLPPLLRARDEDDVVNGRRVLVAIKSVALLPGGSPKLADVQRECRFLSGLRCEQVLGMDALYVDLVEDALWIRMELMERSLADVVGLVDEGLRLQEPRVMARFASDMLQALDYLQKHHIAHRDLRSDNLLLNSQGVLKLTDFSNAVLVTPETPLSTDPAGVVYWQAPEVRSGAYDPLKIDVWSVGATVWELAEAAPPFSDTQQPAERWPAVSQPALYPPAFHEFLRLCSEPAASRPTPGALLEGPFLQKACGRPVIVQLLSRCMAIEQALQAGDALPDSPA